ncbi:conserved Plasmodium protein, unknown function [Plasmodium gallinaceum]|uniref:Nudix hydrolase domain-containing protein n=1 Tax=Plasmodium gallinaceum TaxID=5849 RepID=A0A1J1GSB6_PLAGA|nr:conserved Plasmodium protein, unknown function [Plasmodium gallinaceum]CRG95197.1 conserved Plasmodium protein, unknown function [Plasmodium gallinaceum]
MKDYINYNFEDNKSELVIIVNDKNEFQELQTRKVMRKNNLWHRSTSILVLSKNEQNILIYIHKRSKIKDYCPSYYSIGFGGVLSENENFLQNAVKELYEESGIVKKPEQLFDLGLIKCETEYIKAYITFIHPDFQTTPQLNEVEFISKISLNDLDDFVKKEEVTQISKNVYHYFKDQIKKINLDEIYNMTI